jgi:deazaflavin-dependent oxidoreductase (nitroreductase family)
VWLIKNVVARLDPWLYRWTGGRLVATGRPLGPMLLLTTRGRRTGKPRTRPVFYLRDGDRLVVCNVTPVFERPNPWILNIQANPVVEALVGRNPGTYHARPAGEEEVARYWPALLETWPAYGTHFEQGGPRYLFVLEPVADG